MATIAVRRRPRARQSKLKVLKKSSNPGMTIEEYVATIRRLAIDHGIVAHESYWYSQTWRRLFEGFTPSEAWDYEQNPALYAM